MQRVPASSCLFHYMRLIVLTPGHCRMQRAVSLLLQRVLSGAMACLIVMGCSDPAGDVVCAPLPPWAVSVDVRDSVTNAPLIGGSTGSVQLADTTDILYPDILYPYVDSALVGGYREGLVEVRVERPGYASWSVGGVRTRLVGSSCPQWDTQRLTARLQPE
jgi:hypothetical protein